MTDRPTRRLNILECKEVYRGQGSKGEYVIYEVTATREDGTAIELPLRSFADLDRGVADYTVTPYDAKGRTTYTVAPVKGGNPGARLGPKVDELRGRVEHLETQMQHVLTELQGLRALAGQPSGAQAPSAPSAPSGSRFGDAPPF